MAGLQPRQKLVDEDDDADRQEVVELRLARAREARRVGLRADRGRSDDRAATYCHRPVLVLPQFGADSFGPDQVKLGDIFPEFSSGIFPPQGNVTLIKTRAVPPCGGNRHRQDHPRGACHACIPSHEPLTADHATKLWVGTPWAKAPPVLLVMLPRTSSSRYAAGDSLESRRSTRTRPFCNRTRRDSTFDMAEVPGLADALAAGREDALAVGLVDDGHRVVAGRTAPCEDRSARGAA